LIGLTFDSTTKLNRITDYLRGFKVRPVVRLICDAPQSGFNWSQLVDPCRFISQYADIMISVIDSYYMKNFSAKSYAARVNNVLATYGQWAKIIEIGNEVSGDWLGPDEYVYEKLLVAAALVKKEGLETAVTHYLDGNNPSRMIAWARQFSCNADYQLVSWYPNWSPEHQPDWNQVFKDLAGVYPTATLGFGEFGPQPKKWTEAQRISLIRRIYSVKPAGVLNYQGFGFYWNTYQELGNPSVLRVLRGEG
jgi:hypothetical protein